ncbi:GRIM-19 protein-domain-containing protein [Pisolithus croceorrhizus]|nr:GRIM-19 protein-domain-containing protein [Pisolithus croceorrhizus]
MPPPGGFEAVKYKRNLPFRGPSGLVILGAVTAVCAYGFYRVGMGNLERRELQREKVWSRIHLVPLLLAEGDRDAYRRQQAALEREKEIMKDVKGMGGWEERLQWETPRREGLDAVHGQWRGGDAEDDPHRWDEEMSGLGRRTSFSSRNKRVEIRWSIAPAATCRTPLFCYKRHSPVIIQPPAVAVTPLAHIKATPPATLPAMPIPDFRVSRPDKDSVHYYPDYDNPSADTDQMIFGPIDLEDHSLLHHAPWDSSRDYAFVHPVSPILSDQAMSPRRPSDFDIPDASPATLDDVNALLDGEDNNLSQWLNDSYAFDPSSSSPIPIRPVTQSNPLLMSLRASELLFLSIRPSMPCIPSLGLYLRQTAPTTPSLRPPSWASQLWDPSLYPSSATSSGRSSGPHAPLSEIHYTAKKQRFQPRREINPSNLMFQPSSAPSPLQSNMPTLTRGYSRRAESVSIADDPDATIRRKKKSPPVQEELSKDLRSAEILVMLTPIVYLRYSSSQPYKQRSLLLKQARERENEAYLRSLSPEEIKRENAFRTAQRKAGRSRKSNLKDLNAPKKPLSAYFMFLQHIRSDPVLVREVFGDEQETTKQSPFLAQAEQEKLEYEAARRLYEEGTTGPPSNINFSILPSSPTDSPFHIFRNVKSESFSSESESEGMTPDDRSRYTRF